MDPARDEQLARLHHLADSLRRRDFTAEVRAAGPPSLTVTNPASPQLTEQISVRRSDASHRRGQRNTSRAEATAAGTYRPRRSGPSQPPRPQTAPSACPPGLEHARPAIDDPEPCIPGSVDDIDLACDLGHLADAEHQTLTALATLT